MSDSTALVALGRFRGTVGLAVIEGFGEEWSKSAVSKSPSTGRPRCTPTSTCSSSPFLHGGRSPA
jgi:hypothetical protein